MDLVGAMADHVAQMNPVLRRDPALRQFGILDDKLKGAPRFLFDNAAIRMAVELTLGRPKVLREALAHLEIPYPVMWVEWDDHGRSKLREELRDEMQFKELRPLPGRVGFLLESDGRRRGTATWLWTTPDAQKHWQRLGMAEAKLPIGKIRDVPNIGLIQPYFDLDQQYLQPPHLVQGLASSNLFEVWADNPVQRDYLWQIWKTAEHRPSEFGRSMLRLSSEPLLEALAYADVFGEYIGIWGCLLLLTASRPIIERTPIAHERLNKARRKRGERPLFDFVNVTLRLNREEHVAIARGPLGHARKSPRVHLVSSYLARRGDKHWAVLPYWRGKGEAVTRRVFVQG
jgi:hypothetical protein